MTLKRLTTISAFLILPLLLTSLGSSFSSLTRIYVGSGEFVLSIFLGALVTSTFYTRFLDGKAKRVLFILLFGVAVPFLYVSASYEVYGSGFQEYSQTWSPIYAVTTLIGLVEIILYIGIFFILFVRLIRSLIKTVSTLVFKQRKDETQNDVLQTNMIKWSWLEGEVDTSKEYIELRYGRIEEGAYEDWMPIAYIAAPKENIFRVQFLIEESDKQLKLTLEAAKRELNFYLVDKGEPDPWSYAKYHTTTMADVYSSIHWSFFSPAKR